MLRMCRNIWLVAYVFPLPCRWEGVEQWCFLLVVKSATAAPIARCEESWITSASLLVVSFPFRGKDIIEFLNVWPKCLGIMNTLMNLQSVRDAVEKAISYCALILAWVVWLSWWGSVEKIPFLCLRYVVSTTDHFHSAVRKRHAC